MENGSDMARASGPNRMNTPKRPPPPPPRPRKPVPASEVFTSDEEPTRPTGIEFQVALLARYYCACAPQDRLYLMRQAERFAARNVK